jgi:hypothetical protein
VIVDKESQEKCVDTRTKVCIIVSLLCFFRNFYLSSVHSDLRLNILHTSGLLYNTSELLACPSLP